MLSYHLGQGIWVWDLEPSILIGLAVWTVGYLLLGGPLRRRFGWGAPANPARQIAFHAGTLLALFALVSPLDHLSDTFLLSAHMLQHLLLLAGAPPLWLAGIPPTWFERLRVPGLIARPLGWLTHPIPAFILYNTVLFGWHIPQAYEAALYHPPVHILEHLSFITVAFIAWWPVLGCLPQAAPRASQPMQMAYLFFLMLSGTLLGAFIALNRHPIYPFYLSAPGVVNGMVLPGLAGSPRLWGLSPMIDQQISGLIMWIPGNMIYFVVIMIVFANWLKNQEIAMRAVENLPPVR